jgi:hypothetical protein
MRNKTYRNLMRVWNYLQTVKHYEKDEALQLAHKVFENVEADKNYGNRTAEAFMDMIIPAEEFYAQC